MSLEPAELVMLSMMFCGKNLGSLREDQLWDKLRAC